jgi:transcriptional regulator with XRE-family HTH domain
VLQSSSRKTISAPGKPASGSVEDLADVGHYNSSILGVSGRLDSNMNSNANGSQPWLVSLREVHEISGLSYRDVAVRCDLDHSYVALLLEGRRRPSRDILTLLFAFGYGADLDELDRVLILAGHPPYGRSARQDYRKGQHLSYSTPAIASP